MESPQAQATASASRPKPPTTPVQTAAAIVSALATIIFCLCLSWPVLSLVIYGHHNSWASFTYSTVMWWALVYIIYSKFMSITSDIFVLGDRLWLGQPISAQATASTVGSDESLPPLRFVSSILEKLAYIVFYLFQFRQIAYYVRQGTESTEDAWFWAATSWVLIYAFHCAIFYAFTSTSHYCLGFIDRIIVSPISKQAI
jgi:hypothetical protein